jgi:hypothetical protein
LYSITVLGIRQVSKNGKQYVKTATIRPRTSESKLEFVENF